MAAENPTVSYHEDSLTIQIPTKDPEGYALALIQGLLTGCKAQMLDHEHTVEESKESAFVMDFLKLLMTATLPQVNFSIGRTG
jgi:hypothetical protein